MPGVVLSIHSLTLVRFLLLRTIIVEPNLQAFVFFVLCFIGLLMKVHPLVKFGKELNIVHSGNRGRGRQGQENQ